MAKMLIPRINGVTILNTIKSCWQKNKTRILTAGGLTLMTGACIGTGYATVKAVRKYDEIKAKADEEGRELTKLDILKECGPCYVITGSALISGIVCIIASDKIQAKDTLALASMYKFAEEQLERKERVEEEVLDSKEVEDIRTREAAELMDSYPVPSVMETTGFGDTLFFDPLSGRYFRSSRDHNERAVAQFNHCLFGEVFASVNDFYDNLDISQIELGTYAGWRSDRGFLSISYTIVEASNGEPCWCMIYSIYPRDDYRDVYGA